MAVKNFQRILWLIIDINYIKSMLENPPNTARSKNDFPFLFDLFELEVIYIDKEMNNCFEKFDEFT